MKRLTKKMNNVIKPGLTSLLILIAGQLATGTASAANLSLSDVPLDVHEGVAPNVLLTFDDSGSMGWSFLPDNLDYPATQSIGLKRGASSAYNFIYYDPTITYTPGVDENGNSLGNSTFTSAWTDGYHQANSLTTCTVDLSAKYRATWYLDISPQNPNSTNNCDTTDQYQEYKTNAPTSATAGGPAYYYAYDTSLTGCTSSTSDDNCYRAVEINDPIANYPGGPNRTDCANPMSCTYGEESQNFANWYSYYRTRILLAKTAAGRAFAKITGDVRVAHQSLNGSKAINLFKAFTGTHRTNFFSWLYNRSPDNSTPMPDAYVRAGNKFTESGINSPYAHDPGTQDLPEYACRQNFNINFTDGYWNSASNTAVWNNGTSTTVGNYDGSNQSIPTTQKFGVTSYAKQHPYSDSNSNYLADYAFYYWINDLRPDLDDTVPTYIKDSTTDINGDGVVDNTDIFWNPVNDPANWQHMVTFNVGLGINGNLSFNDTTYKNLINGSQAWTTDHVDDLWHAAINGRGQYFSAKNPNDLVRAFTGVLNMIGQRTGSSSAPAPSAPNYQVGTKLYQPIYDTSDWHGNLRRYDVTNLTTVEWNAMDILNGQDYATGRNIISFDPVAGKGIPFLYASLNASQQAQLISADVVNYIRGDRSKELSNGGTFRNRTFVLGDIVDSAPAYIGSPDRLFPDSLETAKYSDFAALYKNREPMVWVGANDGILHGFDANTGVEKLGFVPTGVFNNLPSLTSTSYSHKFFVDGSPTERDAFFSGNWHTVLVGGLNRGGQEIYALDVTNPAKFTEANAAGLVLWEFTDANDPDLGYTFSAPQVAKTNDTTVPAAKGRWMAFFGNGYNNTENDGHASTTGDAVLYIVDVRDGSLIRKLDTGVGMAQDPTKKKRPNGLSTVALVDADANYTVDYIYAGDLFGNLWKFDVTSNNPANWTIEKNVLNITAPLFIATDASGNVQPITTAPVVGPHASQSGFMINFGTGKYMELGDLSDTSVQTFYGVWDRNESAINTILRKHTQEQTILETVTNQFTNYSARITSSNPVNWYAGSGLPNSGTEFLGWHMDLVNETKIPVGERVTADPQRRSTRIIFVTNTPSADPCMAGGSSWIMELNATTGQRLYSSPFDYNNDGIIDSQDLVQSSVDINGDGVIDARDYLAAGSGIQSLTGGKLSRPTILLDSNNNEVKLSSTGSATISKVVEKGDSTRINRRSWQILTP